MTDFTIIRRSMLSRRFSTITTAFTVAVAVALMLTLLSLRDAARVAFERGSGNMHLIVSRDSSQMEAVLNGIFYARPPQAPITWAEYQRIAAQFPFEFAVPVQQGDSYRGFPTLATTSEFFQDFKPATDRGWDLAEGRFFQRQFEVVAGAAAARGAGLKRGDRFALTHGTGSSREGAGPAPHIHTQFQFEVVGTLRPTGTSHDRALFINLDSSWLLHAFDRLQRQGRIAHTDDPALDGHDDDHDHDHDDHPPISLDDLTDADRLITGIYLRVASRPGSDASALLPTVFDAMRRDRSFTVASPADQVRRLFVIVGAIDWVFLAMAAAVMVSSGIAIMVALYNSMERRRRQVAVLRVLGASRARIFGLVVTESALLGIIGAAGGLVVSAAAAFTVAAVMESRLGIVIVPAFGIDWVLAVLAGTVALAALAGLAPAVLAYRTEVAKNLRPLA